LTKKNLFILYAILLLFFVTTIKLKSYKGETMDAKMIEQIKNNPNYKELIQKRSSFAWTLTIVMLVMYYAFILVIAFNKQLLGASLSGGVTTVGIPVGIFIIVVSFVLTGIYTSRANGEFDDLNNKIKEDIARGVK
jgi:uncharacterized membrane protein (DUF485 family)